MLSHDDNNFSTQRRNLILVSAIILAKNYLDIDYSKLNVLTDGIQIGNPDGLKAILWILWIYFFIRFLNKFFEISDKGQSETSLLYEKVLLNRYTKKFRRKYKFSHRDGIAVKKLKNALRLSRSSVSKDPETNKKRRRILLSEKDKTIVENYKVYFFIRTSYFIVCFLIVALKKHYFLEYYFPIIFGLLPLGTLFP